MDGRDELETACSHPDGQPPGSTGSSESRRFGDGAILDEIQRVPDLTSYIQPLVDESPEAGRFILTGSQQFEVVEFEKFVRLHPDLPHGAALIYGGNETQMRTDVAVHPFNRVHELLRGRDT